jgi:hypothetical protein
LQHGPCGLLETGRFLKIRLHPYELGRQFLDKNFFFYLAE